MRKFCYTAVNGCLRIDIIQNTDIWGTETNDTLQKLHENFWKIALPPPHLKKCFRNDPFKLGHLLLGRF